MALKAVLQTTDIVLISALEAALKAEDIPSVRLDEHMSVLEGSLGILPRRLMVDEDDFAQASRILQEIREGL